MSAKARKETDAGGALFVAPIASAPARQAADAAAPDKKSRLAIAIAPIIPAYFIHRAL